METTLPINVLEFYKNKRIVELDKFRSANRFDITIALPGNPQITTSVQNCSSVEAALKNAIVNYRDFTFTVVVPD